MAEDAIPAAAPAPAPIVALTAAPQAPQADKFIVLLKDIERDGDSFLNGKLMRLPAAEADALIAAKTARLASATDIAVGSV